MFSYALRVSYDGTEFSGWQIQANARTVQGELTDAISKVLSQKTVITGAGRTDTGVHAFGQIASFKSPRKLTGFEFLYSVNSILPFSISVSELKEVPENFSARFDAVSRVYYYFISHRKDPFNYKYSWYRYTQLDTKVLNEMSAYLPGRHDFSAFTKHAAEVENLMCNLKSVRWFKGKNLTFVRLEADRFLHGMVRSIVGTLIKYYQVPDSGNILTNILTERDRTKAGESAPARGLFLYKIYY